AMAPVARTPALTLAISAPAPAPAKVSATRPEAGSAAISSVSLSSSGWGVSAVMAERTPARARMRCWRAAPAVTPSAAAISAGEGHQPLVGLHPEQGGAGEA